jgi:tRNA pseudouridine55 synthase
VINGIVAVDKPLGWTSHDVVARIRRIAGQKQVGHAGTLDPLATGVLLVMLGSATRLSPYLTGTAKEYCAEVVLGATTVTDDAEAPLLEARDAFEVGLTDVESALELFVGDLEQVPPRYAAVKRGGERMYVLARRGEEIAAEARHVTIERIDLLAWDPPRLRLRVACGAGTYIRALARDIGGALGVGAYLHALRRTASGTFTLNDCVPLADLLDRERLISALQPPDRAVITWAAVVLSPDEVTRVLTGRAIPGSGQGKVRMYAPTGDLLALGEAGAGEIKPFRVFGGGCDASGR